MLPREASKTTHYQISDHILEAAVPTLKDTVVANRTREFLIDVVAVHRTHNLPNSTYLPLLECITKLKTLKLIKALRHKTHTLTVWILKSSNYVSVLSHVPTSRLCMAVSTSVSVLVTPIFCKSDRSS